LIAPNAVRKLTVSSIHRARREIGFGLLRVKIQQFHGFAWRPESELLLQNWNASCGYSVVDEKGRKGRAWVWNRLSG